MRKISFNANDWIAGILSGIVMVIIAIAFTALIFKESLSAYFSIGMTLALIGSAIINLATASFSSFRFGIARVEPAVGAILAIIFANIASEKVAANELLPTLIIVFALVSLLVGAAMFVLGFFRLGQIARFLPYPVLGGIVAGTAWIMMRSSFQLLVNKPFTLNNFTTLLEIATGVGFAIFLLAIVKNNSRSWLMPLVIIVSAVLINLFLYMTHVSHSAAIQTNWLFHSFTPEFILKNISYDMFQEIDWTAIFLQINYIASLVGVIIIMLLLNVSGLETIVKGKADLDKELKIAGVGNLISGLLMSSTANLSLSGTILNKNAGAEHRISGIIASIICLIVLFISPNIISYFPKPIIAGLLFYIAFKLLFEWLYEGWKKLPLIDYLIVISILITVATLGFLPGVLVGIIITCLVFIIRYARIDAVKFATNGSNFHSNVIRPLYQQKWLAEKGDEIQVFKLQGYLFFGSAKILLDKITNLIEEGASKLKFLIFDFQSVNGVDSSAVYSFIRLQQLTNDRDLQIIFTGCSEQLLPQFKQQGIIDDASSILFFPSLDQGMEWCEDELLQEMPDDLQEDTPLSSTLSQLIKDKIQRDIFKKYLEKISVSANAVLFSQGDIVDCLYFIESGHIAVFIENDQSVMRVSKSGGGTIVGEIGFYLHTVRTATVRTETDCIMYKLTENAMIKLENEHPEIALIFHKGIVNELALRVIQTNYELMTMMQ